MAERICSVASCERVHRSRGWCALHYYQWQRSGAPWPDPKTKSCAHCRKSFTGRTEGQRYCSRSCVSRAYNKRHKVSLVFATRSCDHCGTLFVPVQSRQIRCSHLCTRRAAKRRSSIRRRGGEIPEERQCDWCGGLFKPYSIRTRFCSGVCLNRSKDKRRAARWRIRRLDIFERDGWICQICRSPIDPKLRHPHSDAATVDHRVPVILGGSDDQENLQAAHMRCNSSKGARWM